MTKPRKKPARTTKPRRMPAGAGGHDDAVAAAAEQLRTNPLARSVYQALQARYVGPDPLAVGGCEWPETLTSGQVLHVAESEPLLGWRMWLVAQTQRGPRLIAPFLTAVYGAHPSTPGVSWAPGTNTNSTYGCQRKGPAPHPRGNCRCGIRAVQSLSVLRGFVANQRARIGRPAAVAQVEVFGRVAGYAPDDDWSHTLRAEQARIVGALHVRPGVAGDDLSERYGVPVVVGAGRGTAAGEALGRSARDLLYELLEA